MVNAPKAVIRKNTTGGHTASVKHGDQCVARCGATPVEAYDLVKRAWDETCDYLFNGDCKLPDRNNASFMRDYLMQD